MGITTDREKEFESLVERFAVFIRAHIQKYGLAKYGLDPEDIIQEVRIKLWKLVCSEKIIANPASYIRKIVSSSVIDQIRKFRREEGLFQRELEKQISEFETSYTDEISRMKGLEDMLGKAVDALIDSRRQVVKLYLLSLSIPEIAGYLNWSLDKTRNLLYRGLADLRKKLKDMGYKL